MASYQELRSQAEALMAQAEQVRKEEISSVIADIKAKMKQYGISAADLGMSGAARKPRVAKAPGVVKYRGPNGETWAGGLGRKPQWVRDVMDSGRSIEDFKV
ncbi:MAG: H-NS histone family protein [Burkholderiaceae bacterium]|nr:H-NS histone family protein [Burkholderiaceae bacterium]